MSQSVNLFELSLLQTRASRNIRLPINRRLEEFSLTMMEWLVLSVASTAKANGLSMTAVATALDVTMPQVTALCNKLVKMRLLRQKTQASDRRSRHIILTAKGRSTLASVNTNLGAVRQELDKQFGAKDLAIYATLLNNLAHNN